MKKILLSILLLSHWAAEAQPSVTIKKDTIGSSVVKFTTSCYGNTDSSIMFINLHENESTSVEAAKQVLETSKKYCVNQLQFRNIRFITFSCVGKNFTVDPNRIFTSRGALASLKKNSHAYSDEIFSEALKVVNRFGAGYTAAFVNNKKLVIALHNNTNGEPLSIITYKSGSESKNAADVYMNLQQDPDDFFLTTEKMIFEYLKQKGFNVVLQDNENALDDGSLSVYAGKKKIPYINIEAQVGHLAEQQKMIGAVLEYIKIKNL